MNKFTRLITTAILATSVAACSEQAEDPAASAPAEAPAAPVLAPVVNPVDFLAENVAVDPINTQSGEVVEGQLRNSGKSGFLLFGPYVSFAPGTYTVTAKGRVEELPAGKKVRLDVVSGKGKTPHGQIDVQQAGELPSFEFTLPEAVGDLEVRVLVPEGSQVAMESYEVARKL